MSRPDQPSNPWGDHWDEHDSPHSEPAEPRRFPGAEHLQGKSPHEVLERLLDGDPLGIEDLCRKHFPRRAFLLSFESVLYRTAARVAYAALDYRGTPSLTVWLVECLDEALQDLCSEQSSEEYRGVSPAQSPEAQFYSDLADATGIPMEHARLTCIAINNLPVPIRLAFHAIALKGISVAEFAAHTRESVDLVQHRLHDALVAVYEALNPDSIGGKSDLEDTNEP